MQSSLRFSVIIPVFNQAEKLRDCLLSVANQTFRNFETIVVDDASTQDIAAVVQGFDPPVQYLRHEKNCGPGAARNTGIRKARGEYVAFLDGDDSWFPWTLTAYERAIVGCHLPGFVAGREASPAEWSLIEPADEVFQQYDDYYCTAASGVWIPTCAAVIRTELLRKIGGFKEVLRSAEDSDLWLRLGCFRGFVHLQNPPVFRYHRTIGSLVSDRKETYRGISFLLHNERAGLYPGGDTRSKERRRIIGRHARPYIIGALRRGEVKRAWQCYAMMMALGSSGAGIRFHLGFWSLFPLALWRAVLHKFRR